MRVLLRVLSLCGAALLVACASEGGVDPDPTRPAASPSRAESSHLFVSGEACPSHEVAFVPRGAGCVSTSKADLDGDGISDAFAIYALLDQEDMPRSWHMRAGLDRRRTLSTPLDAGSDISYPKSIGATDVDGDGRAEVFVTVLDHFLHGAVTQDVGLFRVTQRRIERIRLRGEGSFTFSSVRFTRLAEGARCSDVLGDDRRELVVTRLWSVDRQNTRWEWSKRVYAWSKGELVYVQRRTGELEVSGYNDPALDPWFEIRCDHVRLP